MHKYTCIVNKSKQSNVEYYGPLFRDNTQKDSKFRGFGFKFGLVEEQGKSYENYGIMPHPQKSDHLHLG